MAKQNVSGREWLDFEHWACEELNLFQFHTKFMNDAERAERFGPPDTSDLKLVVRDGKLERLDASASPEPELTDEEEKRLRDDIEAEDQRDKEELLALAERLDCSIYLAAYLRHLNYKLEIVAEAFAGRSKTQELPKKIKRRK
jgi:hypothetical protein